MSAPRPRHSLGPAKRDVGTDYQPHANRPERETAGTMAQATSVKSEQTNVLRALATLTAAKRRSH